MSLNNNTSELQAILEAVRALPEAGSGGVELPTLTNPATGDDILEGKEAIDKDGFRITGVIPAKAAASVTASGAVVTVPRGYYSADVQKSVSTTAQATPVISVSTGGLITATSTQGEGYVVSGTKSATRQITVQAAATIVPNTTTQTAVASGRYTTGAVTVAPIPSEYVKPSGTKSITANGTHDVKLYESVSVNVSQAAPTLQAKTATPTESQQSVTPDSGYDGLSKVTVNAIPDGYLVGEEITAQDSLITQIQNALQGKAAGGGGGSVETCTVTITNSSERFLTLDLCYSVLENGVAVADTNYPLIRGGESITIENVVKNSIFIFATTDVGTVQISGGELVDGWQGAKFSFLSENTVQITLVYGVDEPA